MTKYKNVVEMPKEMYTDRSNNLQEHSKTVTPGQHFDRAEYPESGGIFRYYFDRAFPAKGLPESGPVDSLQAPKKLITGTARMAREHWMLAGIFLLLPNFITKRLFKSFLKYYVEQYADAILQYYVIQPERFCVASQEIQRAGSVLKDDLAEEWRDYFESGVFILAMLVQWDNAYRFRVQDIIPEIDKEAFQKNPGKELVRIAVIAVQRERGWHKDKGKTLMFAKAFRVVAFLKPGIRNLARKYIAELDFDKIKLDEADEYYTLIRPDYDTHGVPMEERQMKYIEIQNKYITENPQRILDGQHRENIMITVNDLMDHVVSAEGMPLVLFYAVKNKDGKTVINLAETQVSIKVSDLKNTCIKMLQGALEKKENAIPIDLATADVQVLSREQYDNRNQ